MLSYTLPSLVSNVGEPVFDATGVSLSSFGMLTDNAEEVLDPLADSAEEVLDLLPESAEVVFELVHRM